MRKRLSSKLLAVILTIAICATTVLGCLMTVSAQGSCYTFGTAQFAKDDLTKATIDVTFTAPASLPNGFVAGAFEIVEKDKDDADCLVLEDVLIKNGKSVFKDEDGNRLSDEDYVVFALGEAAQTATFELVFGFKTGAATDKTYKVALGDVELAYNDAEYYTEADGTGTPGEITAACEHTLAVVGTPLKTDAANGYSVYEKSVCSKCGETFDGYQLVPGVGEPSGSTSSEGIIDAWEADSSLGADAYDANQGYYLQDGKLADEEETGADWNNAIIIDSAEEFAYLCKSAGNETKGLYYKVKDGIAGFDLSGGKVDPTKSLEDNLTAITNSDKNLSGSAPGFQGHFDGNGITIYGAWIGSGSYAGLFTYTKGDVTIKNLTVTLSYFKASATAGAIVGYHTVTKTADEAKSETLSSGSLVLPEVGSLTIENCSVTDCYIATTGTGWGTGVGAIVGHESNTWSEANLSYLVTDTTNWTSSIEGVDSIKIVTTLKNNETVFSYYDYNGDAKNTYADGRWDIRNCYVNLDAEQFVSTSASTNGSIRGGVIGWSTTNGKYSTQGANVQNCVVIGITPYGTNQSTTDNNVQHVGLEGHFKNVYTDQPAGTAVIIGGSSSSIGARDFTGHVTQLTDAQLKGSAAILNMTALDWGNTWVMDGVDTYPRLAKPGEKSDTIYWDGSDTKTAPSVGSGTKGDPYIISTVAELAYISGQTAKENNDLSEAFPVTNGKYYKIADGIKNIVMQPYAYVQDIMALDSATQTKAYFEKNKASMKPWLHYGWEGSTFCGDIDFNGATVYGIYQESSNNAGLFSNIDAGAVFRNLAIKNSYMTSVSGGSNYQIGAIGAASNASGYGKGVNGIIWAQNCTVANNYMYGNATFETAAKGGNTRSGVLFGSLNGDAVYVDNCLVYGNDATLVDGSKMPLYATAGNTVKEDAVYPEDLVIKFTGTYWENGVDTGIKLHTNMIRNSVVLGCDPYDLTQDSSYRFNDINNAYENVYTDADIANDKFTNGTAVSGIKGATQITAADALGAAAKSAMPKLAWGTDWYCGTSTGYPVLAPFATFGASSVSSAELALVGHNTTYNDDGSVNLNFHFVPEIAGISPELYVGTLDASKFMKLTATESSLRDQLGENALMYTIPNLSARDIDLVWLPTLVLEDSEPKEWGKSEQLALADNAKKILNGEAVYGDDVTDDIKLADKKVAAALLNYGAASDAALSVDSPDYVEPTKIVYYSGSYTQPTEKEADGTYIINTAEELCWIVSRGGAETAGVNYKVADDIKAIVLQPKEYIDAIGGFNALENATAEQIEKWFGNQVTVNGTATDWKNWPQPGDANDFRGKFDGNGVTVYGIYSGGTSNYTALFPVVRGDVVIKNVAVKNSYLKAVYNAAGIAARVQRYSSETINDKDVTLEGINLRVNNLTKILVTDCSVVNCHIETTIDGHGRGAATIIGYGENGTSFIESEITYTDESGATVTGYDYDGDDTIKTGKTYVDSSTKINNCYVNLNENYFTSPCETGASTSNGTHGGFMAYTATNGVKFSNCIVIGVTPYTTQHKDKTAAICNHLSNEANFSYIYTDQSLENVLAGTSTRNGVSTNIADYSENQIKKLTTEQLTGLDSKENMPGLDWDTVWTTTASGYPIFINRDYKVTTGKTICWDGNTVTAIDLTKAEGTADNPHIVETAEQLAWLVSKSTPAQTHGKHFRIADGIDNIVLQPTDVKKIMSFSSHSEVEAYFTSDSASKKEWKATTNYSTGSVAPSFCGTFDGNGVEIYGMYGTGGSLFTSVGANTQFKNFAIKNSFITTGWYGAMLAATIKNYTVDGVTYNNTTGEMAVSGVEISNCKIHTTKADYFHSENVGILFGTAPYVSGNTAYYSLDMENCLIYGNDILCVSMKGASFTSGADTQIGKNYCVLIGSGSNDTATAYGTPAGSSSISNSLILDTELFAHTNANNALVRKSNVYSSVYMNTATNSSSYKDPYYNKSEKTQTVLNTSTIATDGGLEIIDATDAFGSEAKTKLDLGWVADGTGVWYTGAVGDYPSFKPADAMPSSVQAIYDCMILDNYDVVGSGTKYLDDGSIEFGVYGTSLNLKVNPYIAFTFAFAGEYKQNKDVVVTFKSGDTVIETVTAAQMTNKEGAGRYHLYRLKSVPVTALSTGITVTASYNGGAEVDLGTYSAEGFAIMADNANKLEPCDYYANLYEAAKALLFYTDMLAARYGA